MKLLMTFEVNNVSGHIPGIKEATAMFLEGLGWGDVRLVEVREVQQAAPEQLCIGGT